MGGFNITLLVTILGLAVYTFYSVFLKKDNRVLLDVDGANVFDLVYLNNAITATFNTILKTNPADLNLNRDAILKEKRNKSKLKTALKTCSLGNIDNKEYVIDYIKDLLQRKFNINADNICKVIPYDEFARLKTRDKFDILVYIYKCKFDLSGFDRLIRSNKLDAPIGEGAGMYYEISAEDINYCFERHKALVDSLVFKDYINLLAQHIYSMQYGLGVIDEIRDMYIDGISGGVSGIPSTFYSYGMEANFGAAHGELPLAAYNAVWIMFRGKQIRLSCLGFEGIKELIRVTKNIYRYDNPGDLTKERGYIVNRMQDGSRVVVVRPDFAEEWCFFVRKTDVASKMPLKELFPDKGNDDLIALLKWLVLGKRNIALTGAQGSGKSTLMMSIIQFIPESLTIRVQELASELYLRKIYPRRNIVSLVETPSISAQAGLNITKKMDTDVNLLGEVAQAESATYAIQQGRVGSGQAMFTHHAKTAKDLVTSFTDNMIEVSHYTNEKRVEGIVASVLNFNPHLSKTMAGHRYIERVTEIMPHDMEAYPTRLKEVIMEFCYRMTDRPTFDTCDLMIWEQDEYKFVSVISKEQQKEIEKSLSKREKKAFRLFINHMEECVKSQEIGVVG